MRRSDAGRNHVALCAACRLHATLCICALVPRLETRTQIVLVIMAGEARKPSNSGQLAARCLVRSTVQIVRRRTGPVQAPDVSAGMIPLVLFPSAKARPITDYADSAERVALIVPDGSWSQARALSHRGGFRQHVHVTLPPLGPSDYRLRAEPQVGGLATFEAIARALRILEGEPGRAIATAMEDVFRVMVERTLWFRGKLRDDEVAGGVPPAALANDPRGEATRALAERLATARPA